MGRFDDEDEEIEIETPFLVIRDISAEDFQNAINEAYHQAYRITQPVEKDEKYFWTIMVHKSVPTPDQDDYPG